MAKTSVLASRMRSPIQWLPLPCPALSAVKMPTPAKAMSIPANFHAVSASMPDHHGNRQHHHRPQGHDQARVRHGGACHPADKRKLVQGNPASPPSPPGRAISVGDNCRRRIRPLARKQTAKITAAPSTRNCASASAPNPVQGFLTGNDVAGPADHHQQHQQVHAGVAGAGGGLGSRNRRRATQTTPSAPSVSRSAADWACIPTPPPAERESFPARSP